jgi:MGT family glycosyltransferase
MTDGRRAPRSESSAALFAMPEAGHFQRLRPLISDIARRGIEARVFTDVRFADDVENAGGRFVDLFATHPLADADDESLPIPCRYVSFAGCYADEVATDVRRLGPSLVVYDTFAVIGRVVARLLGVPYVNVCAGHNEEPGRFLRQLEADPRVAISPSCHRAVETLRDRHGIADASPFSYVTGLSPFLNVYCEPPAYLTEGERRAFEPIAFYGSLPPLEEIEATRRDPVRPVFGDGEASTRVYVSFGTVVWRYWETEAIDALRAISGALARMPNVRALISLGGAELEAGSVRDLERPNVMVSRSVDQWRTLEEADAFVTHHGLNSTHEAVFHRVPMISYPFFGDQPGLAARCQQLGLATPLADSPRAPLTEEDVEAAFAELARSRESIGIRLAEAQTWEREVIADRGSVLDRMVEIGFADGGSADDRD